MSGIYGYTKVLFPKNQCIDLMDRQKLTSKALSPTNAE